MTAAKKYRRWCVCACCGLEGWHSSNGWRHACYQRWVYAGRPDSGPPPPRRAGRGAEAASRIEDYVELRSWQVPREEAAERLGVSIRTLFRYDRRLKAGAS
ncbi:hypothetical protein E1287_22535 [Actinomadura sp. KC06]|uniref:hypothetical protein n=1 Tax=Actinomadura sp. KC06 TaxID=2530369 RepID=UPI0010455C0B|nr:hypothetical protein [Actinomadura sp. KC06]TDD32468.1 hypothetical protein E1287_22535 [Actinomadura sp. KC06]